MLEKWVTPELNKECGRTEEGDSRCCNGLFNNSRVVMEWALQGVTYKWGVEGCDNFWEEGC
jgi:hypothetical protein